MTLQGSERPVLAYSADGIDRPRYRTIVVDPPWQYNDKLQSGNSSGNSGFGRSKATRGAANHYETQTQDAIASIPVGDWAADDAHMYLWTTNAFMVEAHDLMAHWGFKQKTIVTWVKPQIGMGHYFRNNTEHCLFGVRGSLPALRHDLLTAFTASRGRHSAKPEAFFDLVQSMSPGPYLDVFSRQQRLGWDTWGNECFVADGLPLPAPLPLRLALEVGE